MKTSALKLVSKLKEAGYQAYFAGGSVRDILLGIRPKDYDIATNATPDQVKKLFPESIPVGKAFGVMLIPSSDYTFEIATFRKESGYEDGRRPTQVEFTEAEIDAQRRDFTINGMFYDPTSDTVLDFVEGQTDINNKLVRFIGNAETRIEEDHLRILRAVRFKNTLDFYYHPDTYNALKKNKDLVLKISPERIQEELSKMLLDKNRSRAIEDLEDLGILELILPEIQALKGVGQPHVYHQEGDVFTHTMLALASIPEGKPLSVYWATLLHDSGKAKTFEVREDRIHFDSHAEESAVIAKQVLKRFRYSKNFCDTVAWLCEKHMSLLNVLEMPEKAQMRWFLKPYFLDLLSLHKADVLGTTPSDLSGYQAVRSLYNKQVGKREVSPDKLISGNEVSEFLGIEKGPELGDIIQTLKKKQKQGEIQTRIQALHWLKANFLD